MLHNNFCGNRSAGSGDFLKGFTIYGSHLGHVTSIMLLNFHFHVPKSLHTNLVKIAQWFLRKASFNFHMLLTLGQGQEMTLTFSTHIPSLSVSTNF